MAENTNKAIRIVTIPGTSRPGNLTGQALALVNDEIQSDARVHVDTRIENLGFPSALRGKPVA